MLIQSRSALGRNGSWLRSSSCKYLARSTHSVQLLSCIPWKTLYAKPVCPKSLMSWSRSSVTSTTWSMTYLIGKSCETVHLMNLIETHQPSQNANRFWPDRELVQSLWAVDIFLNPLQVVCASYESNRDYRTGQTEGQATWSGNNHSHNFCQVFSGCTLDVKLLVTERLQRRPRPRSRPRPWLWTVATTVVGATEAVTASSNGQITLLGGPEFFLHGWPPKHPYGLMAAFHCFGLVSCLTEILWNFCKREIFSQPSSEQRTGRMSQDVGATVTYGVSTCFGAFGYLVEAQNFGSSPWLIKSGLGGRHNQRMVGRIQTTV